MDLNNRPFKVVKYATDITDQKIRDTQFKEHVNTISNVILQIANGDLASRVTLNTTGDIQAMAECPKLSNRQHQQSAFKYWKERGCRVEFFC